MKKLNRLKLILKKLNRLKLILKNFIPMGIILVGAFIMIGAGVNDTPMVSSIFTAMGYMPWYGWFGFLFMLFGIVIGFLKIKGK